MNNTQLTEAEVLAAWRYSAGMPARRKAAHLESGSFAAMVAATVANARDPVLRAEPGRSEACLGHWQPVIAFCLCEPVGDAVLNGPYGYRAQYWQSPARGLIANALLIQALAAKLMPLCTPVPAARDWLSPEQVALSWRCASAKFWFLEDADEVEDFADERLNVERWDEIGNSAWLAPRFKIKGALIHPGTSAELVPPGKECRHFAMHSNGWT